MSKRDNLSRRQFLSGRVLPVLRNTVDRALTPLEPAAPPPSSAEVTSRAPSPRFGRSFPILRPPGAVDEEAFLAGCTRCEACIQACPHQAIIHAPERYRRAAGTPMIDPIQQPCWMCADYPCIAACEPKVLQLALPKQMAKVRIETFSCLAWQGSFCSVCSEQCPVPNAIRLDQGKPTIVDDVCTGCGVCQYVCPAPENAILLMPLADRPPTAPQGTTRGLTG